MLHCYPSTGVSPSRTDCSTVGAPHHHHLESSRALPNSFLCGNFSLASRPACHQQNREAANWNVAKGVGREMEWGDPSCLEWWPTRTATASFQEDIWRQNFLVKALLTIPLVSQFISFAAWNQNISQFFAGAVLPLLWLPCFLAACMQKQMLVSVDLLLFVLTNLY